MGIVILLLGVILVVCLVVTYEPSLDCIQDVDLNKIWIIWYNKYTEGGVVREHKILYDTGRDKK